MRVGSPAAIASDDEPLPAGAGNTPRGFVESAPNETVFAVQARPPPGVKMMAERGLSMACTMIMRLVHHYARERERRWDLFASPAGGLGVSTKPT
jgi:hypothetical protein